MHPVILKFDKFRDKIEAVGEVRWSKENAGKPSGTHSGVMFLDLDPAQVKKICRMRESFTSPHYKAASKNQK